MQTGPPRTAAAKVTPETLSKLDDYGKKVVQLGGRPQLHLDLAYTGLTDADLVGLEVLPMVTSIDLTHTKITDAGIEHLKNYPQLEKLTLVGVPITEKSIEHFKQMPRLWQVYLNQVNLPREAQLDLIKFLAPRAQAETRARDKRISSGPGGPM